MGELFRAALPENADEWLAEWAALEHALGRRLPARRAAPRRRAARAVPALDPGQRARSTTTR